MAEILGNGRIPDSFAATLSAWFQLTGLNVTPLSTELQKGGGIHAFLVRLTAEAAPVPGLAELTILGVDCYGGAHILHLLFYVPVGPYDQNRMLLGCRGELPPEGLPSITNIQVASFGALRAISAVSREDHRVHLEGVPPSGCQMTPCKRASTNEEG